MKTIATRIGMLVLAWLQCEASAGCSDNSSKSSSSPGGATAPAGVGQGGAADFGRFRGLLDQGMIPAPETLDAVGFLNEHKLELPAPDCGQDVCIHGELGVMGNLMTGANCTMVLIGTNTPRDPTAIERQPLSLALAVDVSGSMAGEKITRVKAGLLRMLDELAPDDRVSLVAFSDLAQTLVADAEPSSPALESAIKKLAAVGSTNIYDGLRLAFESLEPVAENRQRRVLLLSDGEATAGLQADDRIVALARAYAGLGLGVSTIGLGQEFDIELMRSLAEEGAGTFYFVEDAAAVEEVFGREVGLTLVPLARDAVIDVSIAAGYKLRAVYGARLVSLWSSGARIEIPVLQLASRTDVSENAQGRRGGGGAIILELTPAGREPALVGDLGFSYRVPGIDQSDQTVEQSVTIDSPLAAGETPARGYFPRPGVEKAFVALNILVGFKLAAEHSAVGEYGTALATLQALDHGVRDWLAGSDDDDIADDLDYIVKFEDLLKRQKLLAKPKTPPEPWPAD